MALSGWCLIDTDHRKCPITFPSGDECTCKTCGSQHGVDYRTPKPLNLHFPVTRKAGTKTMAKIEMVVDDLSGTQLSASDAEEFTFMVDGVTYVMDLGMDTATAFRDFVAPYIEKARVVEQTAERPRVARQSNGSSARSGREDGLVPSEVRAWAQSREGAKMTGMTVNDRGRMPESVFTEYAKAHQ